ncbi:MAG: DUF167 domain-containing protein [Nanoarchaeota archaeon]
MIINVKVKPGSSEQKVSRTEGNSFIIKLKSKPENNKANIELIKLTSKYFSVPHTRIKIKSGLTGLKKIVEFK